MALFSSIFRQLFERFAHFLRKRETPQKAQKCAAQELAAVEKLPEAPLMKAGEKKAFDFNVKYWKRRKRCCQVKKERERNEEESQKDKAEKERETLSLKEIKIKEKGHVQQKKRESDKLREIQSLESEHREAGEKKNKKRKLKERKTTEPAPLLVEVKPQVNPPVRSSVLKPIEAEPSVLPSVSEHFALPATRFKPLPPVTKPPMRHQKPAAAPEEVTLPGTPLQVDPPSVSEHSALPAAHFKPFPPVTKPSMPPRKPAAAPEEVTLPGTPFQVDPPSVSKHFVLPATRFKSFPPVTKRLMHPQKPATAPEEVILPGTPLQVDPPKPLAVPPSPTPASDELFSLRCSQVSPPKRLAVPPSITPAPDEVVALQQSSDEASPPSLLNPQPATSSLFEPPPQLMLIDIEDEENEYVEYTGKTIQPYDLLKSERPRLLEAEINPRMSAWLESDSEVLEEVWASEVVEVLGFGEEKDDSYEMLDSKAIEGHLDKASQKKEMDEHMIKLFCVTSPEHPKNETQHHVNVQEEPKSKRKVPLVLFTWAEEKAKKKEEKKIQKEKERRDKELLLERYTNDPKLKHLLINKHNRHYRSSE
ncbi:stress response NST1-like isoform X1 [Labeo rohita]|uniref:Stress response NST1-like isoform X1 n=1 Tax=Labeo rohita TaxID=84645 RepID=A0A498N097_LABRO|nr:stress response NST1-like isoform X1 [Labeo rohita]